MKSFTFIILFLICAVSSCQTVSMMKREHLSSPLMNQDKVMGKHLNLPIKRVEKNPNVQGSSSGGCISCGS